MRSRGTLLLILLGIAGGGFSEESFQTDLNYAQVVYVRATEGTDGLWRFDTTVRHADGGWRHYADLWQVLDAQSGEVIAERVLLHPHDQEQPFKRSLGGIRIPEGVSRVRIRAKCNVHGFGGRELVIELKPGRGESFEVIRR